MGDLTQWKHYSTDFLTKKVVSNNGDNPDIPIISLSDHHEGLVSREIFNKAQAQIYERGKMSREGRKYSKHYWFSSKAFCGKCGYTYNISGRTTNDRRTLRCVNRGKYGANHRIDKNGAEVGCDNKGINEKVLEACMKHILEYVQVSKDVIVESLYKDIEYIR